MSHHYIEGSIFHKRFNPVKHKFTYPFFMLDIDLSQLDTLNSRFFSVNGFNLFSFHSKDHFGDSDDFMVNVHELLKKFDLKPTKQMHFITLPRILGFVFNPISTLVLFNEGRPVHMLAEVHNYNSGRVIYSLALKHNKHNIYTGSASKDMHVSPFFKRDGDYRFMFEYDHQGARLSVILNENKTRMLISTFTGKKLPFRLTQTLSLFCRHTFLTVWVVTRTLWQSLKLKFKGLKWYSPQPADRIRRY